MQKTCRSQAYETGLVKANWLARYHFRLLGNTTHRNLGCITRIVTSFYSADNFIFFTLFNLKLLHRHYMLH